MDLIYIALLLLLAAVLAAVEVFLIPGFGLTGLSAIACIVGANLLTFAHYGTMAGVIVMIGSLSAAAGMLYWMVSSKTFDRIGLKRELKSTAATAEQLSVKPGDEGRATTRLALVGNADFGGRQVEVRSADGFLDEGTPVVVTRVENAQVWVKRLFPAR